RAYGLDKPWPVAYFHWLGKLVRLDLGDSFREGKPVIGVIGERIGPTLLLSTISIFLAYLLAIPLGLYATARSGKIDERSTSVLLYALYSLHPTWQRCNCCMSFTICCAVQSGSSSRAWSAIITQPCPFQRRWPTSAGICCCRSFASRMRIWLTIAASSRRTWKRRFGRITFARPVPRARGGCAFWCCTP